MVFNVCVTCVVYDVMSCVFAVVLLWQCSVVAVCVRACFRLNVFVWLFVFYRVMY